MTLNLVIIGKSGQLALALQRVILEAGHKAIFLSRAEFDLSWNEARISDVIAALPLSIDVVILTAAYTEVDVAEDDESLAFAVNADAPGFIAKACAARQLPLVHISTDYVFDGTARSPYQPEDKPAPLNVYGRSKLAGEIAVRKSGARTIILRTSWVFDGQGSNFMTSMLGLAQNQSELSIVDDQIGRPTYAGHLALAVLYVAGLFRNNSDFHGGIYHVTGHGDPVSWAGFARAIFQEASNELSQHVKVTGIPAVNYPTPAARTKYSVLDMSAFEKDTGYKMPTWQDGLLAALAERRSWQGDST